MWHGRLLPTSGSRKARYWTDPHGRARADDCREQAPKLQIKAVASPRNQSQAGFLSSLVVLVVVERNDGVIHMEIAPNEASAGEALGRLLAEGMNFKRAYIRRR